MSEELRFSIPGDEEQLKDLWRVCFHDTSERIDGFFNTLYTPGTAAVSVREGVIISAAYVVRLGDFVSEGRWTPCRAICAFVTRPEERGHGCGGQVLRMAVDAAATSGLAAVCPGAPSFFPLFEKLGFRPMFTVSEHDCVDVGVPLNGSASRVTVRGYAALREELLHGRDHIDFDLKTLAYQELLCNLSGGGLFYLVSDGVRSCAAVETDGEKAFIRELIVPSGSQYNAAALAARAVGREKFVYRSPVRTGDAAAPFAMLRPASPVASDRNAWYGFDFR